MNDRLTILTAHALAGLASRPGGGHLDAHDAAAIGQRAVELASATLAKLEELETAPEPAKNRKR